MVRFDAYSATTTVADELDLDDLLRTALPGSSTWGIRQGRGFHTFKERVSYTSDDGGEFAAVQWGGRQEGRAMLEVKGEATPKVVEALRARFPHRCTRVDSCADFDAPKAFERLYHACRKVKRAHRLIGGKAGDWDDHPEKGRTLYLGAATSSVRMRLYEKGKQAEYAHLVRPDWARMEIQVRPSKQFKETFSRLSPDEVWGAASWSRDVSALLLQHHVDPHPAGTTWRRSDRDRAIEWMCRQYGPHLTSMALDLGGWDVVGLTLMEIIKELASRRSRGVSGACP